MGDLTIRTEKATSNINLNKVNVIRGYVSNTHIFSIWKTTDVSIMKPAHNDKWRIHVIASGEQYAFERKSDAMSFAKAFFNKKEDLR